MREHDIYNQINMSDGGSSPERDSKLPLRGATLMVDRPASSVVTPDQGDRQATGVDMAAVIAQTAQLIRKAVQAESNVVLNTAGNQETGGPSSTSEQLHAILSSSDSPYKIISESPDFDQNNLSKYPISTNGKRQAVFTDAGGTAVATASLISESYDSTKKYIVSREGRFIVHRDPVTKKEVARIELVAGGATATIYPPDVKNLLDKLEARRVPIDQGWLNDLRARITASADSDKKDDLMLALDDEVHAYNEAIEKVRPPEDAVKEQIVDLEQRIFRSLSILENESGSPTIDSYALQGKVGDLQRQIELLDPSGRAAARVQRIIAARVAYHHSNFAVNVRGDAFEGVFQDIDAESHKAIFRLPGFLKAMEMLIKFGDEEEGAFFRIRGAGEAEKRMRHIASRLSGELTYIDKDRGVYTVDPTENITRFGLSAFIGEDDYKDGRGRRILSQDEAMTAVSLARKALNIFGEAEYYDSVRVKSGVMVPAVVGTTVSTTVGTEAANFVQFNGPLEAQNFLMEHWEDVEMKTSGNDNKKGQSGDDIRDCYSYSLYVERKNTGYAIMRRFAAIPLPFGIRRKGRFDKFREEDKEEVAFDGTIYNSTAEKAFLKFIDAEKDFAGFSKNYRDLEMREWAKQVSWFQKNHGLIDKILAFPINPTLSNEVVNAPVVDAQGHHAREEAIERLMKPYSDMADMFGQTPNNDEISKEIGNVCANMLLGIIMVKLEEQHRVNYWAQKPGERKHGSDDWNSSIVKSIIHWAEAKSIISHEDAHEIEHKAHELSKHPGGGFHGVRIRMSHGDALFHSTAKPAFSVFTGGFFKGLLQSILEGVSGGGGGGPSGH